MKTFITVLNHDRHWYARRSMVLSVTVGLIALIGVLILANVPGLPLKNVSPLLALSALVQDALMIAAPFVFILYAVDLGRSATPYRPRIFIHTLPVDRRELALAKLLHGFVWIFFIPLLLCIIGVLLAFALLRSEWPVQAPLTSMLQRLGFWIGLPLWVLVCLVWTMLLAALLPGRWLVMGVPLLIVGEAVARNITTTHSLVAYVMALRDHPRSTLSVGLDLGLVALMALLLSAIFVRYHMQRNRTRSLTGAFLVLAGIDALRALACWYTTLRH